MDYICIYCNKQLILTDEFVEENDIIECSSCKNTFKFIPKNLLNKEIKVNNKKQKIYFLFFRFFLSMIFITLFYFLKKYDNSQLYIFITINYISMLLVLMIYFFKEKTFLNYKDLFVDKYINTFSFWLIISDILFSLISYIIFFAVY